MKWRAAGLEEPLLYEILNVVSDRMDYPNSNFFPKDNLFLFVNDTGYEFSVFEILDEISRKHPQLNSSLNCNLNINSTMLDFIKHILSKHPG